MNRADIETLATQLMNFADVDFTFSKLNLADAAAVLERAGKIAALYEAANPEDRRFIRRRRLRLITLEIVAAHPKWTDQRLSKLFFKTVHERVDRDDLMEEVIHESFDMLIAEEMRAKAN